MHHAVVAVRPAGNLANSSDRDSNRIANCYAVRQL